MGNIRERKYPSTLGCLGAVNKAICPIGRRYMENVDVYWAVSEAMVEDVLLATEEHVSFHTLWVVEGLVTKAVSDAVDASVSSTVQDLDKRRRSPTHWGDWSGFL
jgi:hypothetical protein